MCPAVYTPGGERQVDFFSLTGPIFGRGWHSATITSAWSSQDGEIGYVDTKRSILLSLAQTEHQPFLDHAKLWLPICVGRAPDRSQRHQIVGKFTLCNLQNMICPKVGDFWADNSISVKFFSPYLWVAEYTRMTCTCTGWIIPLPSFLSSIFFCCFSSAVCPPVTNVKIPVVWWVQSWPLEVSSTHLGKLYIGSVLDTLHHCYCVSTQQMQ